MFNFFSAQHLSVNVLTEDGTFQVHGAIVNGSWATQAHVTAITVAGMLRFSYWASKISPRTLIGWSNGTCGGRPFKLVGLALTPLRDGPKNRQECGEVVLQSNYSSVLLSLPEWNITVSPRAVPSYDHQKNWLSGPKVRLDLGFSLRVPEESLQVAPHGIIGQSFDGDGIGINGARDPEPRAGTNLTTAAMAEGAIEGSWRDYVMESEYDTAFKFSRFGAAFARPRDTTALTGERIRSPANTGSAMATENEKY